MLLHSQLVIQSHCLRAKNTVMFLEVAATCQLYSFKLDDVTMHVYRIKRTDHMSIMIMLGLHPDAGIYSGQGIVILMCTNATAKTVSKSRTMTDRQVRCLLPREPCWC